MTGDEQWGRYGSSLYFQAGSYLFKEGDPAGDVYVISSGQVVITKDMPTGEPLVLSYRGAGEIIGEVSLLSDAPRTASVMTTKPTSLSTIPSDEFWRLLKSDESFQQAMLRMLIERLLIADESRIMAKIWERDLCDRLAKISDEHERLAEIMQLRQETMSFIVHDLRNPVNLAMTALSMLELVPGYDEAGDTARFMALALGALQRTSSMIDTLLDVERLDDPAVSLEKEPVNLPALIKEVLMRHEPIAAATRVELALQRPPEAVPSITVDRQRIERVLINLIDNAVRYTPPDGKVTASIWQEDGSLSVSVNDTGPGIAPEHRERIFDRFVRVETGLKTRGFGLGLAYCRSAVRAHGGQIWVEGGDGGTGTKFLFTLPL